MDKFKQLSLNLLSAKKQAQDTYLKPILPKKVKPGLNFTNMSREEEETVKSRIVTDKTSLTLQERQTY